MSDDELIAEKLVSLQLENINQIRLIMKFRKFHESLTKFEAQQINWTYIFLNHHKFLFKDDGYKNYERDFYKYLLNSIIKNDLRIIKFLDSL